MKKQKRQKYSNGGGTKQEVHQDVGHLHDRFESKQKGNTFGSGSVQLSPKIKLNASVFKNKDVKVKNYGAEAKIGNTTVGANTNQFENSVSVGRGNLRFEVGKPKQGKGLRYGITYNKTI